MENFHAASRCTESVYAFGINKSLNGRASFFPMTAFTNPILQGRHFDFGRYPAQERSNAKDSVQNQ